MLLLSQSQEMFAGESTLPALNQIFSLKECRDVLALQPNHLAILSQFKAWEWVDYENYCALFFAEAIAATFPSMRIYIDFPEMLGLGYRTVQAKRSGILDKKCVIAVTMNRSAEDHGSALCEVDPRD